MRTSAAHRPSRDTFPISRMPVLTFPAGHLRTGRPLAVERVLDMCRTSVYVISDSCGAVIIAHLTGEDGVLDEPPLQPEKVHHKY